MADIASDLISNIEGYLQLLTTLSLGMCAGTFALVIQVIFHNADNSVAPVRLKAISLVIVAIVLLLFSIGCGIATKSVLVSAVPAIHAIQWGKDSAVVYLEDACLGAIINWAMAQVGFFILGVVALAVVLIANLRLLR